jgi:hypothetical protein
MAATWRDGKQRFEMNGGEPVVTGRFAPPTAVTGSRAAGQNVSEGWEVAIRRRREV